MGDAQTRDAGGTPGQGSFSYAPRPGYSASADDAPLRGPIRLRPIQHIEFPLWDAEGWLGDDFDWLHETLGLAQGTYLALARWQSDFERQADFPRAGGAARDAFVRRGHELCERLRRDLSPRFEVVLEL